MAATSDATPGEEEAEKAPAKTKAKNNAKKRKIDVDEEADAADVKGEES